jgi:hypothetical protein
MTKSGVSCWYFGGSWGAPICTAFPPGPTPLGELCLHCEHPIEDGQRGLMLECYDGADFRLRPSHLGCIIGNILPCGAPNCSKCAALMTRRDN